MKTRDAFDNAVTKATAPRRITFDTSDDAKVRSGFDRSIERSIGRSVGGSRYL